MLSFEPYFGDVWITRLLLQRGIAAVYLIAFIAVIRQFKPLLGERGLLPVPAYVNRVGFRAAPSIFSWKYSDRRLDLVAWTGLIIAACAVCGFTEAGPVGISVGAWLLLWVLYLSIVNVGQSFFGFGWESMLLEAGFFAAFLAPSRTQPSVLPIVILRWMLFRTELGAGLIKLRHDPCWRDLTCLFYHYETQPLPNPLSWYFHRLPRAFHRFSVLFSHFVQVIVPFGLFAPQPIASVAALLIIFHQLWLIISGNYSWLNWLTAILGTAGLSDRILAMVIPLTPPPLEPRPPAFELLIYAVSVATVLLSMKPVLNLFSRNQLMNFSYNRFHLVNTYGAFGSVGRERYEIVMEGTSDRVITPATEWKEYEFKAKPGDPKRIPPQIAPYHLRLDWLIWFLPFSVAVTRRGILVRGYDLWFLRFVQRLLTGDSGILCLMQTNPFPEHPPMFIRALFYRYRYTDRHTHRQTGAWWTRELLGNYLEPISFEALKGI
jgi:lipase maturation factor